LDEEQNVLLCKSFSLDDPTRVTINPDEFAALIVANKPSGLVIVHNHLKGTYLPSEMDDRATRQFALICSFHNVFLCDHYIYSPQGVYSYYQSGRLQEIAQEFAICSLVDKKE
jgi:DNA repair protein RadC